MNIRLFLAFVLACLTCGFAGAQTNGGDIDGTLLDESGHPAAEVSITIENSSTERLNTATTDENGRFHFESVPAGEYEIVTDLGQTEPAIFEIRADRVVRIELQTTSGGASAEKATLQVVPVDSDTGQITTTFSSETIALLPQPNYMSPGGGLFGAYNQSLLGGAVVAPNPIQQAHGPIVAGMPALSNNFHVDGVDNNNRALPGPLVYLSNEATSDFSLQQNADSPRFGHPAGGQLNSIVSSGAKRTGLTL